MLARTDRVAVAVMRATVYSTGTEFDVAVRRRSRASVRDDDDDESLGAFDPFALGSPFGPPFGVRTGRPLPLELLRFGVQFSDGRKATTTHSESGLSDDDDDDGKELRAPVLESGRGGGGNGRWESRFWLWPLPPPGLLVFVVEWPSEQIPETRREINAALLLDASRRVESLWPEDVRSESRGGTVNERMLRGVEPPVDDDASDE